MIEISPTSLPTIQIGQLTIDGTKPFFILGPCVIESEEFLLNAAAEIDRMAREANVAYIFKASYDKANRTSIDSFRGMGVKDGCRLLAEIGKKYGVPVTTDVHSAEEAVQAAEFIDLLQIPAFLCRQTDLVLASAQTGRAVSIKKGQFLAPWDVPNIARKVESTKNPNFFFIERGSTFGYNNLVADMRSLYWIRELGYRVVFDATHSVQRPGGQGGTTGGDGILAPVLARAAIATGCDGIFLETHPHPERAFSDGPNQIPFAKLPAVLNQLSSLDQLIRSWS